MSTTMKLYGLILALILSVFAYTYHLGGERALLRQRLHASDSTIAALTQRARTVDTLYRTDTVHLRVAIARWDTVRQTVEHWDTARVAVPAETVKVIVRAAEQVVNACSVVVLTCEQRVAQRDSIIAVLKHERPLIQAQRPGRLARWRNELVGVALGVGVGYIAGKH